VYNIPQHNAIDFVAGNDFHFVGDTSLLANPFLQNFHLRPSRITNQVVTTDALQNLYYSYPFLQFNNKRILLIDKPLKFNSNEKIDLDLVVVSHNPKLFITELTKAFNVKQFVFDASNPLWKISKWKKDCDSLHLPHYSTRERGAFVMSL
jgi:competence protein ComEC